MKPHWIDACQHDRENDRFLGSFSTSDGWHDVYVYQDNALSARIPDMHVCVRYGSEGHQYMSPGPADGFVRRVRAERPGGSDWPEIYTQAAALVAQWLKERDSL